MSPRRTLAGGLGLALLCLAAALPVRGLATVGGGARPAPGDSTITLRLPADIVYPHAGKGDSAVVFSHGTHVPLAGHRCATCHPAPYPMLRRGPAPRHRAMTAGGSCGMCHDGRKAFGTRDLAACATCHSGTRASRLAAGSAGAAPVGKPRVPGPYAFRRGADSPGPVTFRHATHLRGMACSDCHPKPYAMSPAASKPGGAMHEAGSCGACHDGRRGFACDDADACGRCHAGAGS